MKQRDIWLIDFNPVKESEQRGIRPGVVISGNSMNDHLGIAIVCPLSSKIKSFPGCMILTPNARNGLGMDSEVLVFQVRTVSKERFIKKLGEITGADLADIKRGLDEVLSY
jgi:mRNA interferase MazF